MRLRLTTTRIMLYIVLSGFLFRSATMYGGNMQNALVDLTTSVVEFGRLDINPYYFNSPDISRKDGLYYSGMAPGASFLAVPFYAAAKAVWACTPDSILRRIEQFLERKGLATYSAKMNPYYTRQTLTSAFLSLAFGFLGGALAFWLVTRIASFLTGDPLVARRTGLIYACATVMIFYHTSFYTQSIGVLFLLLACYFAFVKPATPRFLLLAGVCCGIAGTVDYPFLVYGGVLALTVMLRLRFAPRHAAFSLVILPALGFAVPVFLLFAYHTACFGSPLRTPYGFRVDSGLHVGANLGMRLFRPDRILSLLFHPYEGVVTLMPFLLFFPCGAWFHIKQYLVSRRAGVVDGPSADRFWFALAAVAIFALAFCYFVSIPWISYMTAYGPRFFLAAIPFMTLLAYPRTPRWRVLFWGLVAYSVLINQLNMVSANVPNFIYQKLIGHPYNLTVTLFQIKKTFAFLPGLAILIALQLALLGAIFLRPHSKTS